jgi:signal transduction histidine kinase/ligand-binding sensor domain-containing protein/DNA-binding response OmpR family regulator
MKKNCTKYIIGLVVSLSILVLQGFVSQTQAQSELLKFNHLTTDNGLSQNSIHSILKDKYGFMWFGTWEGVNRFDGYSFKVFRANEDDSTALSNNRINAIVSDSARNIWVSTGDPKYLFRFNFDKENFTRFPANRVPKSITLKLNNSRTNSIKRAENSKFIWVATNAGLQQTNKQTNRQTIYQTNRFTPFSLTDHVINAVYLDDCKNLWIGTQNGGVNCANLHNKTFAYYSAGEHGNGLSDNVIRAICQEKNGKLWVGTDNEGITVIDRNRIGNNYTQYGKDKLIDSNIRVIYCDKLGFVWIGTKGGLDRFDPRTRKFRHYFANVPGSILNPWVFWVMEDHNGYLWVGTFNGIAKYDRKNDRFQSYNSATIGCKAVRVIFEDHKYNLWVGTEDAGIAKLTRDSSNGFAEKLTAKHYRYIPGNENSLINNMVLTMTEDADHKLWIGTNSGLCRFDSEKGVFKRFSVKTGFPDDLIMGLLSDGKNHIWISHKKGLTSMDIRTLEMRNFNVNDGLQGYEFTQNAYYRNPRTGEMFFGGTNGLNSFYPDSIVANPYKLRPVLTKLKVMNQPVEIGSKINNRVILNKSLLSTDKITLTWWDKNFSIEFSALNFVNPQSSKFKYMLEGIDHQWSYTDASIREATYTHLPAGLYTFKVYSANSDGVWSDLPATVKLEILPPWWWAWWAKIVYVILSCLLLWFIYRYISARIEFRDKLLVERLKNEKNEELARLKLQFFTEVSHEFRTPLTLIIDPLQSLLSDNPDKEKIAYYHNLMLRNANQLLELINQLLDFRKLESGNLPLKLVPTDLIAFVRNTAASFENRAHERNIQFSVKSTVEQLFVEIDIDKMGKVMNNLLSNAFKFTPENGEIGIDISIAQTDSPKVILKISDTGIGIAPEALDKVFDIFYQVEGASAQHEGSGIGLALTKELLLLHKADITVESEVGKGSIFSIELPYNPINELNELDNPIEIQVQNTPGESYSPTLQLSDKTDLPLLLIVDDNADIRQYIQLNFNDYYRIIIAVDGADGFQKATDEIPDIIISDIMMPVTTGIEMCRMIKTDERTSHIPVILLTARQSDESKIEGLETGADAYVTKPFSTQVLQAQLTNLLDQRLRLRQLFSNGTPVELKKIAVNFTDEAFLNKVLKVVIENMEDTDFDPDILAEKLKMSRSQLYRKIKAMTNQTVLDFMTTLRMNKAIEYMQSGEYSISETAYKVGYSLPTNFTRSFVKQFGETPSNWMKSSKK